MKLSAAIRIGSMTTRQIIASLIDDSNGRCVIGAALEAISIPKSMIAQCGHSILIKEFPIALELVQSPISKDLDYVDTLMWKLNDGAHWSREKIADWVETIEQQKETDKQQKQKELAEVK